MTFSIEFTHQTSILIDRSFHACLADLEFLTTVFDLTTLSSPTLGRGGTSRWMSLELIDAESHGHRGSRHSDRYDLGIVIYEVLSGRAPFYQHPAQSIPGKMVKGGHPEKPQGVGGAWRRRLLNLRSLGWLKRWRSGRCKRRVRLLKARIFAKMQQTLSSSRCPPQRESREHVVDLFRISVIFWDQMSVGAPRDGG